MLHCIACCTLYIISPLDCSHGLPAFLVAAKSEGEEGLNSGFMIAQYTAAALGEQHVLAHSGYSS